MNMKGKMNQWGKVEQQAKIKNQKNVEQGAGTCVVKAAGGVCEVMVMCV